MAEAPSEHAGARVHSESEATARLAAIVEGSADAIFTDAPDGTITSWNSGAERLYGYGCGCGCGEVLGRSAAVLTPPGREGEVLGLLERVVSGEAVHIPETTRARKDGTTVDVSLSTSPVRDREGAVVEVATLAHDISELRRAEAHLRQSEERFRYAFDHSPVGTSVTLPGGQIDVNQASRDMVGHAWEEIEHTRWQDLTPAEDIPRTEALPAPILSGATDRGRFEKRCVHEDGSIVWAVVATSLRRDAQGAPQYFVTAAVDIRQKKLATEALRTSEARYRELVDHLASGMVAYEPTADGRDFVIRDLNAGAQRIEHLGRDEAVGRLVTEAFPGVEEFGLLEVLRHVAAGGEPESFPTALSEDERLANWRENKVYRPPTGEVVAVYEDVTERVQAEQEAARAKALLERDIGFYAPKDAALVRVSGNLSEITERKLAELALCDSERRLRRLYEAGMVGRRLLDHRRQDHGGQRPLPRHGRIHARRARGRRHRPGRDDAEGHCRGGVHVVTDASGLKRAEQDLLACIRRQEAITDGVITALARTIEVRDPYTAGHERRVSEPAAAIAREPGLDGDVVRGVQVAGRLHDVGKRVVPAEILARPAAMTPLELELIHAHARAGYEVLEAIELSSPVAEIVLQHHERLDGSGYPRGLRGDEFMLQARILGVADVIEAMVSRRPCRPALSLDEALAEIESGAGGRYDTALADAALRLFRDKGFAFHDKSAESSDAERF